MKLAGYGDDSPRYTFTVIPGFGHDVRTVRSL